MNLIDKEHRAVGFFKISENRLKTLLKIPPIFRACKQCTQVERVNRTTHERFRHFAFYNLSGEALGYGRFADSGLAYVKRIILAPATQNLHRTRDFKITPNQGINLPRDSLLIEINGERR